MSAPERHDEAVPLSNFSSPDFAPTNLLSTRAHIGHTKLLDILNQYEKDSHIQLVSLVNDNYSAFLRTSIDVTRNVDGISGLRAPIPTRYCLSKREVDSLKGRSTKMKEEIRVIRETRSGIEHLSLIVLRLLSIDAALASKNCKLADEDLLSMEYERIHAEIEAIESVSAGGYRATTPFLTESLIDIREELGRLRGELVHQLLGHLETLSLDDVPQLGTIYTSLSRLDACARMIQVLKSQFSSSLTFPKAAEDFSSFLVKIQAELLSQDSLWSRITTELSPLEVDVVNEVIRPVVERGLLSSVPVNTFIPTLSNMEVFYNNFSSCRAFFSNTSWDIVAKFKTSIYTNLQIKRVGDRIAALDRSDPQSIVDTVVSELLARRDVILDDPNACGRVVQFVIEDVLGKIRDNDMIWTERIRVADLMIDVLLPLLIHNFDNIPFVSKTAVSRLMSIETALFKKFRANAIAKLVDEATQPILQTLESVKQVPVLYRVAASRGAPTRHSVYVDLAIKAFSTWRDSSRDSASLVIDQVIARTISGYMSQVKDVVENTRGGIDDRTRQQLVLDSKKLYDFFNPLTSELSELNEFIVSQK